MVDKSNIFSGKALAKLRGPEELDTMMKLTSPHAWVGLATLGVVVLIATVWGFIGSVPVRVQGLGVILRHNSEIYDVTAPALGMVTSIDVSVNQEVTKGQRIIALSMPPRETEMENAKQKLDSLRAEYRKQSELSAKDLENRRINTEVGVRAQRANIAANQSRLAYLRELYATQQRELTKGYVTRQQVEDIRSEIDNLEQSTRDARLQVKQLKATLFASSLQRDQTLSALKQQILDAENNLSQTAVSLVTERDIVSPVDGKVVEVDVKLGTLVDASGSIAVIEKGGEGVEAVTFFEIAKGKKISPGMRAQVSPGSVERDLYGSILGKVTFVGSLPATRAGLMDVFGNEDMVSKMMAAGPPIKVVVSLEKDPNSFSGLKWSSSGGPPVRVTPGDTTSVDVIVKNQRPIELVVPIFKAWTGKD